MTTAVHLCTHHCTQANTSGHFSFDSLGSFVSFLEATRVNSLLGRCDEVSQRVDKLFFCPEEEKCGETDL